MSFYANPELAARQLAERVIAAAQVHQTVQVHRRAARIHIRPAGEYFMGRLVGIYTAAAQPQDVADDVFEALTA